MKDLIEGLGGRKFIFTLLIIGVGTAVELYTERGMTQNFVALLLGSAGIFAAGNSASKFIGGKFGVGLPEGAVGPDSGEVIAAVQGLTERVEATGAALEAVALTSGNTQKLVKAALFPPQS